MNKNFISRYYKSMILWIIIGVIVTAIVMIIADISEVIKVFNHINLNYLPFILALAPLNYLFRFLKWNYYLKLLKIHLPPKINRSIFFSGLSMTITPGKIGELLKSYLIKEYKGTEVSKTSSIIMAERVTDAIAMIILASLGSLMYEHGTIVLPITLGIIILGIFTLVSDKMFHLFKKTFSRVPIINKYFYLIENFQESSKKLFTLKSLIYAILLGLISWGFEGIVVFLALKELGGSISLLGSIFVVSFASIIGGISFLPGGLIVAEGSIMGILMLLDTSKELAAATTVITRFSTLWLGVIIGMVALFFIKNLLIKYNLSNHIQTIKKNT